MPKFEQPVIGGFPTEFTNTKTDKPATKKPATKKPATKKENTMPENAKNNKPAKANKKENKMSVAEIKERFFKGAALVAEMYEKAQPIPTPVNPGNESGIVNRDPDWNEAVRYIASEFGWTDPRFVYGGVMRANGGKPKDGAYGVPSFIGGMFRLVYNVDDVEWEGGAIPTDFKKPERKKAEPKPKKRGGRRATAPKGAAPEIAKLEKQIAEMKAANEALAAQNAQTTAILAALAAKLGV